MFEQLGNASGILTAIVSAAVTWGIITARLTSLERDIERVWQTFGKHVAREHFDAVIKNLQEAQAETQKDIKEILHLLSNKK